MTDDIREALQRYAAPGSSPVGATGQVLASLERRRQRRRRRRATLAASASVLAVLVAVGVVAGVMGGPERQARPAGRLDPGEIVKMSPSPLGARHGTVGAWTGSELIVVGGTLDPRCRGEIGDESCPVADPVWERGGAAYDPDTDTWRRIADAPEPIGQPQAARWGDEVVVVTRPEFSQTGGSRPVFTLAYDPGADTWRTVTERTPEVEATQPIVTDEGLVFPSSFQDDLSPDFRDRLLDPDRGTWTTLPRDPFASSESRSLAWDGKRLWLMSATAEAYTAPDARFRARIAVLEGGLRNGTWRVVEQRTPVIGYQSIAWSDGRLLIAPDAFNPGQVYDVRTGTFTSVPRPADNDGCPFSGIHAAGVDDDWVVSADDATLMSPEGRTAVVPPCGSLLPDFAVWAGEDLLMWGGLATDDSPAPAGYRYRPPTR